MTSTSCFCIILFSSLKSSSCSVTLHVSPSHSNFFILFLASISISAQYEIGVFCSSTQTSNIHTYTLNMNWWVVNWKACQPAEGSISHSYLIYLILPFIRERSKRLHVGKISYSAQFSLLPPGVKFNFPGKVCNKREKKINIQFLSRGGSVTHLKERDGGRWAETD